MKKAILLILACVALSSCALKPIPSQFNFVKTNLEVVSLDSLGNGTIMVYNGANFLHKIDNTARLNIWIDEKPLGQIRPSEYVIINLKDGKRLFKAVHIDMVKMSSLHDVVIDAETKVIEIKPTVTSNKLTVTNAFPEKFEKFKYAEKR